MEPTENLRAIYDALNHYFGDLHCWPGESQIEIIIGAILTQNTAWHHVEIAINRLKHYGLLDFVSRETLSFVSSIYLDFLSDLHRSYGSI